MGKINWSRVILGGLLAAVVMMGLALLNAVSFQRTWFEAVSELVGDQAEGAWGRAVMACGILMLLAGVACVWLYAAVRPRYGPGPKTAAIAGLAMWFIPSAVDVFWAYLGLIPTRGLAVPLLVYLPIVIVATISGAWLYKEDGGPEEA